MADFGITDEFSDICTSAALLWNLVVRHCCGRICASVSNSSPELLNFSSILQSFLMCFGGLIAWADKWAKIVTLGQCQEIVTGIARCPLVKWRLAGAWLYPLTHQTFLRRGGVGRGWRNRQERGWGGDRRVGRIDTLLIIMASLWLFSNSAQWERLQQFQEELSSDLLVLPL